MEAGHAGEMAPDSALRTATALACPGTTQKSLLPDMRVGIVTVSAWVGTESRDGKQPSLTCCWREASSRATTLTAAGSSKEACGGSLKARCPFSPIPKQTKSIGAAASKSAYRSTSADALLLPSMR